MLTGPNMCQLHRAQQDSFSPGSRARRSKQVRAIGRALQQEMTAYPVMRRSITGGGFDTRHARSLPQCETITESLARPVKP